MTQPASPQYRAVLGDFPPDAMTHASNISKAEAMGLQLLHSWQSSRAEWIAFEQAHQRRAEQAVADNPTDEAAQQRLRRREKWMDAAERWGFDTLGFGLYLFRVPEPAAH